MSDRTAWYTSSAVGDFDKNGKLDVAVPNIASQTVDVWLQ